MGESIKYTILTCLFGEYDSFKDPEQVDPNAYYICITDRKDLQSNIWTIIYLDYLDTNELTGTQKNFMIKYRDLFNFIHKDSKYIIKLDMSIQIHLSLQPIIQYIYQHDYDCLLMIHSTRDNFIDEYNEWIKCRKLNPIYKDICLLRMSEYGYNINMKGLCGTTFAIYKINTNTISFIEDINNIIQETSYYNDNNDQCYFTYCLYKNLDKLKCCFCNVQIIASKYMDYCFHSNRYVNDVDVSNTPMFPNHDICSEFDISKRKFYKLFNKYVEVKYF